MTQKKQVKQHTSENYISGIILAGGLSTRLGRDKSIEPIENQTLLSRIYQRLLQITNDITVVVNTEEKAKKNTSHRCKYSHRPISKLRFTWRYIHWT